MLCGVMWLIWISGVLLMDCVLFVKMWFMMVFLLYGERLISLFCFCLCV